MKVFLVDELAVLGCGCGCANKVVEPETRLAEAQLDNDPDQRLGSGGHEKQTRLMTRVE